MTITKFGQQLECLLWTDAVEEKKVLNLHHLLLTYKQGMINDEAMHQATNQPDPDDVEQCLEERLPLLFESE